MKKTEIKKIFPLNKGLDTNNVPGVQDPKSLTKCKNIQLRTVPSIKKRPGLRRLLYSGNDDKVQ